MIKTDDFAQVYMDHYGITTKKQAMAEITRVLECIDDTAKVNGGLVFRNFRFKVIMKKARTMKNSITKKAITVPEKHFLTYKSLFDPEALK